MRRIIIASIIGVVIAATVARSWSTEAATTVGNCTTDTATCVISRAPVHPIGAPTCNPARPHASGTSVETISTVDGPRTYRLHVPPSYTGSDSVPVVFDIHGAGSNGTEQEAYSAFSTKADVEGFIVVYPEGLATALVPYTHFNAWMLPSPVADDLGYIKAALNSLELSLCIDQSRVFSTGISNGAMMSIRLACSLSARIAAIAPVAGAYYPPDALNLNAAEVCPDRAAVPLLAFHGTADTYVPFNGGVGTGTSGTNFRLPVDDDTAAEDVMADWSAHNGCSSGRVESRLDTEVRFIQYDSCVDGAVAQMYAVDGGGHTWPGAIDVPRLGYTTHQINATDLIWAFFAAHPMPDADGDSVRDGIDNCPLVSNTDQTVTRRNFIDLHAYGKLFDDTTFLNATLLGDACNADIDGDGIPNDGEAAGPPCASASAPTDPLKLDTDGDGFTDRAECMLGTDPANATSKPPTSYATGDTDHDMLPDTLEAALGTDPTKPDSDGDKLNDGVEFLYYGSDPTNANTDGDICTDGKEAASLNDDNKVNSTDQVIVAQSFSTLGGAKYVRDFDINKDDHVNSTDQVIQAKTYGSC